MPGHSPLESLPLYFLGGSKGGKPPFVENCVTSESDRTRELADVSSKAVGGRIAEPNQARETGAALEAHYRFILWLVPAVERFPRSRKFLLGDRIQPV